MIGIAAHRAAAAGIEAPVGGHVLEAGADNRTDGGAFGENEFARRVERLIGGAFALQLEEGRAVQYVVARLGIGECPKTPCRVELVVATIIDILQRNAGDQIGVLAEGVGDPRMVEGEFRRDPLPLVEVVGDADVAFDREIIIGVRVLEHRLDAGEELRCRPQHARLLEHDAGIVIERGKAVVADAADRTIDAQLLGLAE